MSYGNVVLFEILLEVLLRKSWIVRIMLITALAWRTNLDWFANFMDIGISNPEAAIADH